MPIVLTEPDSISQRFTRRRRTPVWKFIHIVGSSLQLRGLVGESEIDIYLRAKMYGINSLGAEECRGNG